MYSTPYDDNQRFRQLNTYADPRLTDVIEKEMGEELYDFMRDWLVTDNRQYPSSDKTLHHYVKYASHFNYADDNCSIVKYVDAATALDYDAMFLALDMITVTAICLLAFFALQVILTVKHVLCTRSKACYSLQTVTQCSIFYLVLFIVVAITALALMIYVMVSLDK